MSENKRVESAVIALQKAIDQKSLDAIVSISAESREESDKYLTGFQPEEMLKRLLAIVPGVHILECLETNS